MGQIQQKAMKRDFSWNRSAERYLEVYQDLLGIYEEAPSDSHPSSTLVPCGSGLSY
jgi:hypothetical protein